MLIKIMTLRFDTSIDGFDDEPLREFIRGKTVFSMEDHFFINQGIPYITVVIKYDPVHQNPGLLSPQNKSAQKKEEAWRKLITEEDMPLFEQLRDWRSERCKQEGVPPYILFDNKQLARITVKKPSTLAALGEIEGIGTKKIQNYGEDILKLLKQHPINSQGKDKH